MQQKVGTMRANEFLTELWTQPYELTPRATGPANMEYYFDTKDNRSGRIVFDSFLDTDEGGTHVVLVIVHFYIDNLYHTSGKGDAVAIFSTVVAACRDYLRRYKPPVVTFETPDAKKRNLYVRMTGMFPDYVVYPYLQWVHDPIVGDEIVDSLMDDNANDAVVLRRRDYDPKKTRVYIDEQGVAEDSDSDIKLSHSLSPGMLYVHASKDSTDVGGARFKQIDGVWTGDIVHVYPQFRRQGFATMLYDYAEKLVGKIVPSKTLKPKGKKFWANRVKQGVAEGRDDESN